MELNSVSSFVNPARDTWDTLTARPMMQHEEVRSRVLPILDEVKRGGDLSLLALTEKFDKVKLRQLAVSDEEWEQAPNGISEDLKHAIKIASENIEAFHRSQQERIVRVETMPGVMCWRKSVPIEKVGIYIPGGTAPLFSSLMMLAIPAKLAGCKEIVICTPPDSEGKIHPAVLYIAHQLGLRKVFKVGGAQAVAAMAYGTESIPSVYKILGPGNQYVTTAKQLVSLDGISIDMPAGPSEVAVLADASANPAFVAADLLSQAEHGHDSQVMLVSTDADLIPAVQEEIMNQVLSLPRKDMALQSMQNSKLLYFEAMDDAIDFINAYAAEHLILSVENVDNVAARIHNAGSVFLGNYSPESLGDYASGTNHTLPTNGYARMYSGVSLDTFIKKITFQKLSPDGLRRLGPTVEVLAEAEGLEAHKRAVNIRLASIKNDESIPGN